MDEVLTQSFIYEPMDLKVPCGGFTFLGGGIIGKKIILPSNTLSLYFSADDSVDTSISRIPAKKMQHRERDKADDASISRIPAKKMCHMPEAMAYYIALKYGDEYQAINGEGVSLNAISYLNAVGSVFNVKCVGITPPYYRGNLSDEEQKKMSLFNEITEIITSIPLNCVFCDDTVVQCNPASFETEALKPSVEPGVNLVLTLDGAYVVVE